MHALTIKLLLGFVQRVGVGGHGIGLGLGAHGFNCAQHFLQFLHICGLKRGVRARQGLANPLHI